MTKSETVSALFISSNVIPKSITARPQQSSLRFGLILKDKKEPDWLVIDKEQKAQLMADLEDAFHLSSHEKSLPFFVCAGVLMHRFLEDSKTADQKPVKE